MYTDDSETLTWGLLKWILKYYYKLIVLDSS